MKDEQADGREMMKAAPSLISLSSFLRVGLTFLTSLPLLHPSSLILKSFRRCA